jgi:hypothetical protein
LRNEPDEHAAAVSAMPGIAFSESFAGRLRAYSTKTGEIVWEFDAKRDFDTVNKVPAKGGSFNGAGPAISKGMVIATCRYGSPADKRGMCCWPSTPAKSNGRERETAYRRMGARHCAGLRRMRVQTRGTPSAR